MRNNKKKKKKKRLKKLTNNSFRGIVGFDMWVWNIGKLQNIQLSWHLTLNRNHQWITSKPSLLFVKHVTSSVSASTICLAVEGDSGDDLGRGKHLKSSPIEWIEWIECLQWAFYEPTPYHSSYCGRQSTNKYTDSRQQWHAKGSDDLNARPGNEMADPTIVRYFLVNFFLFFCDLSTYFFNIQLLLRPSCFPFIFFPTTPAWKKNIFISIERLEISMQSNNESTWNGPPVTTTLIML